LLALLIIAPNRTKVKYKEVFNLEKFYSCEEIAERYSVKIITVYDWIKLQKLPAVKIGKQYRITAEDLAEFERRNRTVPSNS
jgi:excisionase family DNA binding protein